MAMDIFLLVVAFLLQVSFFNPTLLSYTSLQKCPCVKEKSNHCPRARLCEIYLSVLLKESLSVESLSMTDAFPQMQDAPAFVEFDSAEVARLLRSNPMRSLRQVSVLLQVRAG